MRRNQFSYSLTASLEDITGGGAYPAQAMALEELDVVVGEAANLANEIDQDLQDVVRAEDNVEVLENTADIAEHIQESTPTEAALIQVTTDAAVAGTDTTADELVPATEGLTSGLRRPAVEGLRETASRILKQIMDFLKSIWEKIEGFFYRTFGTIPRMRERYKTLSKAIEEAGTKSIDKKTFKLNSGLNNLTIDGTVVKDSKAYRGAVENLSEAVKYVTDTYADQLKKRGEAIAKAIGEFNSEKPESSTEDLLKINAEAAFTIPGASGNSDRYPDFSVKIGKALPGNMSLLARKTKVSGGDVTPLGILERARRNSVELGSTTEPGKTLAKVSDVEFATMTTGEMDALIKQAGTLMDSLEAYRRGSKFKSLTETRKKIEAASKKAETAASRFEGSSDSKEKDVAKHYRAALQYNTAFAGWVKNPATDIARLSFETLSAIEMVIRRSLAQYK